MSYLYSHDPIIACSSGGTTNTGIAVIRLSGFENFDLIQKFFSLDFSKIKKRYAHFCKIIDNQIVIDEIILTYFEGPNSFNGENILELSVHGNIFNIEKIIKIFTEKCSFRKAYPGEFSYRAFRNKKLSLTQIEGLDLFLNASNPLSLKQGLSLLSGSLQRAYEDLLFHFKNHKSAIELSIDFLDDVGEEESNKQVQESFLKLKESIESLKLKISNSSVNLIDPEVVLVGQPNAGKSSLFNLLLNERRAIVSDIAGTTRDFISEKIRIEDNFFKLIDTAGIRKTDDTIEEMGIKKSYEVLEKAFFKILLINPYECNEDYFSNLDLESFDLIIFSHSDNKDFEAVSSKIMSKLKISGSIEPLSKNGSIEPKDSFGPIGANTSLKDSVLSEYISKIINKKYLNLSNSEPILLSRHVDQIKNIYSIVLNYENTLNNSTDISIISSEFNIVGHCISELIGIVSPDEVLHNIFENFCIGK